jgi:hypothetical protein
MIDGSLKPLLIFHANRFRLGFMTAQPPMRFAKVHAVSLHHKAVHVATLATCAQTVPELLSWIDDEARFVVVMEGTETDELLAALRESDAAAANERH